MSNARDKANIPALNFSSTGIDDNATSTAITIDSSENVTMSGDLTVDTNTLFVDASENTVVVGGTDASSWNTNADELVVAGASAGGMTFYNPTQSNIFFADGTTGSDVSRGRIQYVHTNNALLFGTDATERMRIDSSGNVGIGTSSPNSYGGQTALTINNSGVARLDLDISDTIVGTLISESTYVGLFSQGASTTLRLGTNNTNRMRILSDGSVQINHDTREDVEMLGIRYSGNVANGIFVNSNTTNNSNAMLIANDANGVVGKIRSSGTSTSYITTSDYRLKENVNYDFDATTRLKQLKPARFNFIADADIIVDGFLAHEVQDIVPEAISGEKDETKTKEKVVVNANGKVIAENIEQADWETGKIADEDGNTKYPTDSTWETTKVVPVYQGIDQSKLVPLLVKTIQELEARITTLENA